MMTSQKLNFWNYGICREKMLQALTSGCSFLSGSFTSSFREARIRFRWPSKFTSRTYQSGEKTVFLLRTRQNVHWYFKFNRLMDLSMWQQREKNAQELLSTLDWTENLTNYSRELFLLVLRLKPFCTRKKMHPIQGLQRTNAFLCL